MSPYIYQLLMKGEIKLPVLLEDVEGRGTEVPAVHSLYQPLRQAVYAVLFNLNHQKYGRKQVGDMSIQCSDNRIWGPSELMK